MQQQEQQDAELAKRPSVEAQVARLTEARDAVRDRLTADLGLTQWSDRGNAGSSGCASFPESRGDESNLATMLLTGGVPDAQWREAASIVQQATEGYGFGPLQTVADQPGVHEIYVVGDYGAVMRFGTSVNATLGVRTGCHLKAALLPAPGG